MNRIFEKREYNPGELGGESLERELFGVVRDVKDIEEERKKVEERMKKSNITEEEAAMEEVKTRQTENPTNPRSPFANYVRVKVLDLLDIDSNDALKFYTAVSNTKNKTMLDRDFGIDAFLELIAQEKNLVVSIDLTNNISKTSAKAEIVEYIPDDFPIQARFEKNQLAGLNEAELQSFDKYTDELAEKVADKFKKLIKLQ